MNTAEKETPEEPAPQYRTRSHVNRRVKPERRLDTRTNTVKKQGLKIWVKSLTSPRLGVDRRKGSDQRSSSSLPSNNIKSLLTQEEIADLLR